MKFRNQLEEKIASEEAKRAGISLEELFVKKRKLELGLTDFRKSQMQKERWWKNRWKYMRGIHKFHRSTKGKEFHRNLGRFLSTREFEGSLASYQRAKDREDEIGEVFEKVNLAKIIDENREFLIAILSALTHALIEKRYYQADVNEEVEYNIFLSYLIDRTLDTIRKVIEGREQEVDFEFWQGIICKEQENTNAES